jgi:choline dehydrogenase-like flavoprotein
LPDHYDVIVIGTGAGGGTLAHTLAPAGKRILLLERGNFLPRETENWDPEAVFVGGRYISKDTWYDAEGKPFQPQVHYFVGGATKMYGAALYRLRPQDFEEIQHVDGVSPAWPLSYDDFEPWYTRAEWLYPGARRARRGPYRGPLEPAVPLPGGLPRAAHAAARRRPRQGRLPPLPRAVRGAAGRERPAQESLHPLDLVRRSTTALQASTASGTVTASTTCGRYRAK